MGRPLGSLPSSILSLVLVLGSSFRGLKAAGAAAREAGVFDAEEEDAPDAEVDAGVAAGVAEAAVGVALATAGVGAAGA